MDGEIGIRERLGLDPLRRVDYEDGAFTCGERARDLVREIDVAWSVDEVQDVLFSVARRVAQRYRSRLDRDPALLFELHVVEHLLVHLAFGDRSAPLEDPVGKRGLAVVDVSHDREVADQTTVGHEVPSGHRDLATGAARSGAPFFR